MSIVGKKTLIRFVTNTDTCHEPAKKRWKCLYGHAHEVFIDDGIVIIHKEHNGLATCTNITDQCFPPPHFFW